MRDRIYEAELIYVDRAAADSVWGAFLYTVIAGRSFSNTMICLRWQVFQQHYDLSQTADLSEIP